MQLHMLKPLSNNAALAVDEQGKELVVTGRGVSYGRRSGDLLDSSAVEKTFRLSSESLFRAFQGLIAELSIDEVRAIEEIVTEIRMSLGRPISESLYVSLADHVHFSLANFARGVRVPNSLQLDVIRFYPDEFALGQKALDIIESQTGLRLSDDEAGFIALHIVNAEIGDAGPTSRATQVTKIIEDSLAIVRQSFDIDLTEDSIRHYRFINHLRYFGQRIVSEGLFSEDENTRELLSIIAAKYPRAYRCAREIEAYAVRNYGASIGCDELLYLTIHIQHATQEEE